MMFPQYQLFCDSSEARLSVCRQLLISSGKVEIRLWLQDHLTVDVEQSRQEAGAEAKFIRRDYISFQ
jgi:hypothetical protein